MALYGGAYAASWAWLLHDSKVWASCSETSILIFLHSNMVPFPERTSSSALLLPGREGCGYLSHSGVSVPLACREPVPLSGMTLYWFTQKVLRGGQGNLCFAGQTAA